MIVLVYGRWTADKYFISDEIYTPGGPMLLIATFQGATYVSNCNSSSAAPTIALF